MLHRKLIRLIGKSASDLITEMRLKKAFELLENDAATVSEIAYLVGYSSPSYFNKVFKKTYKISPGEVKKKGKGKIPHLRVIEEPGVSVSTRSRTTRFKIIATTNILMIIIVTLGALSLLPGAMDRVSSILRLPEWTINLVLLVFIVGVFIANILSRVYDIRWEGGILKTEPVEQVESEDIPRSSKLRKSVTYLSLVVIAVLILYNIIESYQTRKDIYNLEKSVAVLPFVDMSAQKDQEYFCDGIAEDIINALTHVEDLNVIARTSAFSFKGKQMDIREIGHLLGAGIILEGSVRKEGKRLRINVQLIETADGSHLWSEEYDRDLESIFDIQDEISLAIAEKLEIELQREEKTAVDKK